MDNDPKIHERLKELNSKRNPIDIDPKIHERLKELNAKLSVLEKQIYPTAVRLGTALKYEMENGIEGLLGCDLVAEIECYTDEENTEPVCILREPLLGLSTPEELVYFITDGINHNDRNMDWHFMKGEHHCWLYHCLYDHIHPKLSWEQMASIERFWINIKPLYQYKYEPIWDHKTTEKMR